MNLNSCLMGQAFLSGKWEACDASVYKKGEQCLQKEVKKH